MRGIVLAGGTGSRLWPLTMATSKHLLPVFDKPMVYYPLSVLMMADIRDVLLISKPEDGDRFRMLLGDGSRFGCRIAYAEQPSPAGIAEALLIGGEFIRDEPVALILGDNIFYWGGLSGTLRSAAGSVRNGGAKIFAYRVRDPERYGVVELDAAGKAVGLEEKPVVPKSHYAVPGIYFYGAGVSEEAAKLRPSARGELEITDLNRLYLERGQLDVELLGRGIAWLDAGTPQSLLDSTNFIQAIQERQGLMIACLEEIAYGKGWLSEAGLGEAAKRFGGSRYGEYLSGLLQGRR